MIKNIVFDTGKVLMDYDSSKACWHFIEDVEEQKKVETVVFVSPEWIPMDMGVLPERDALEKICRRLDTKHEKEMAKICLAHWHKYYMWEKERMAELIRDLKEAGFGIYLCSNASLRLFDCYKDMVLGIEYLDGVLFSVEVKRMKSQREMYGHLFERFGLKPEECFFVGDLQPNTDGARGCGMDGYCSADGGVQKLGSVLFGLG